MSEHQQRLWQKMIDSIQDYLDRKNENFYELVGSLEGALDTSEITDPILLNQWYDFWTPLEIRRAIEGNNINRQKADEELIKMRDFLLEQNFQNS